MVLWPRAAGGKWQMEPDGGHRGWSPQDQADKSCSPSILTTRSSRVKKGSVSQGVVPAGWGLEP